MVATVDYTRLYRTPLSLAEIPSRSREWSCFVSGYNDTERVRHVFDAVDTEKQWLAHREYGFTSDDLPTGCLAADCEDEASFCDACVDHVLDQIDRDSEGRPLCIDLTGLMRPHLMYLVSALFRGGVDCFYALYTDPKSYKKQEKTEFTQGSVVEVRQVAGFEGIHETDASSDLLIVGMGYEDELVRRVATDKSHARKLQVFGLPSLEADMYQQSVIRAYLASEALGPSDIFFAPANDPFATAQVLSDCVADAERKGALTNLYLSSLGTKPQALGFALYFLTERANGPTSVIFPFTEGYARETTQGIARSWLYEVRRPPKA